MNARRRLGLRYRDRMGGARDLDRAMRTGAHGHEVLGGGRDAAVLAAEQEPRRQLLPERARARRLGESILSNGSLRGGHPSRLRRRHVRGELGMEVLLRDEQIGRAVAAHDGPQHVASACCPGTGP